MSFYQQLVPPWAANNTAHHIPSSSRGLQALAEFATPSSVASLRGRFPDAHPEGADQRISPLDWKHMRTVPELTDNEVVLLSSPDGDRQDVMDPPTFFDTSAILITVLLLGRLLELNAKDSTTQALRNLCTLTPQYVTLLHTYSRWNAPESVTVGRKDTQGVVGGEDWKVGGRRDEVPAGACEPYKAERIMVDMLELGDVVHIGPGGIVPADGIKLNEGYSLLDESLLTGECCAADKGAGELVMGGTTLASGSLILEVTRIGEASTLGQIVRLVRSAQSAKTHVQEVADKIATLFVPLILGVALLTLTVWLALSFSGAVHIPGLDQSSHRWAHQLLFALKFSIGVMSIACPCALGLATPTAVMVASGVAANCGILVKGGKPLEAASYMKAVVLDKTGTITAGAPQVTCAALLLPALEQLTTPLSEMYGLVAEHLARFPRSSGSVTDNDATHGSRSLQEMNSLFWWIVGSSELNSEHPLGKSLSAFANSLTESNSERVNEETPRLLNPGYRHIQIKALLDTSVSNPGFCETTGSSLDVALCGGTVPALVHPDDFVNLPGRGLECTLFGKKVGIGSLSFAEELKQKWNSDLKAAGQLCGDTTSNQQLNGVSVSGSKGDSRDLAVKDSSPECGNPACTCSPCRCHTDGVRDCRCIPLAVECRTPSVHLLKQWTDEQQQIGCTVVFVHIDGLCIGGVAVADPPRLGAIPALATLRQQFGIEVWMCTGDNNVTAFATATEVGIPPKQVMAQAMPSDKARLVADLQKRFPGGVGMVGDGLNDSPGLAQADVGVAVGSGVHITAMAADVVLLKSSLSDFVTLLKLANLTMRTIRRNFFLSFAFNICGVPIAAGLFYDWGIVIPPSLAGAMMACSSMTVIYSSLLIRRFSPT
eukprot:GHVS01029117.1.p1 GENE.GHVS01029117.1~~GHVS01029117.1.p1  ORF type:complete len:1022 (+),score=120.66 GHVS01029117.1:415-3066(+)